MKKLLFSRLSVAFLALLFASLVLATSPTSAAQRPPQLPGVPAVLSELLRFRPQWITRSVTSHDPWGHNGDGNGNGMREENCYRTLFHEKGEGRILRLWMTANREREVPREYEELWIQTDGVTVFRGKPLDFFEGRGPWQAPLVLGYEASSGAFLSYVPFAYLREAKILFKGNPHYFQVTYREGQGSSQGPTAPELKQFMSENWASDTSQLLAETGREVRSEFETVASGPSLITRLSVRLERSEDLRSTFIAVGQNPPVPLAFFFGLGSTGEDDAHGWAEFQNAVQAVQPSAKQLSSRLPIPLGPGETLRLIAAPGARLRVATQELTRLPQPYDQARFALQYRDQTGPGTETTMPFFESGGAFHVLSLTEEILDGIPGNRGYLEGDEMIRIDGMKSLVQHGTGTEDYYNGGWYFLGAHANAFAGQPRFVVRDWEDQWKHARFIHSLYRLHLSDPIIARKGIRFGFEAGELGAYQPVRYRTLVTAYQFPSVQPRSTEVYFPADAREAVTSAVDAERAQSPISFTVSSTPLRGASSRFLEFTCPNH